MLLTEKILEEIKQDILNRRILKSAWEELDDDEEVIDSWRSKIDDILSSYLTLTSGERLKIKKFISSQTLTEDLVLVKKMFEIYEKLNKLKENKKDAFKMLFSDD
jgi:hypothetical protein